ncbi:calcium-binding protein [Pseudomonas syringae]
MAQTLNGGAGNDMLTSGRGNDTLNGGSGNDTLTGGIGSDLYLFDLADGQDVITDDDAYNTSNVDILRFSSGIQAADVTASLSGSDLLLSHSNGIDRITVKSWFTDNRYQLERVEFADGALWTKAELAAQVLAYAGTAGNDVFNGNTIVMAQTLNGGAGNDMLTSGRGNDILNGGSGNDTLTGGIGSDLYLFDLADGQDVITDDDAYNTSNVDILRFSSGIQAADVTASLSGSDLLLSHSNGIDRITVKSWFTDNRYQLERVEFADGALWTKAELAAQVLTYAGTAGNDVFNGSTIVMAQTLNGGAGNDMLTSGRGNDILNGGSGNDTLTGGIGSDLYLFDLADGQDVITDDDVYNSSNVDILRFGSAIQAVDITASLSGIDLVLSHSNGLDEITFKNWFLVNNGRYQAERVEFADGTLWKNSDLLVSNLPPYQATNRHETGVLFTEIEESNPIGLIGVQD